MRPAPALAVLLLAALAGCAALGGAGGPEPTPTLTPAAVPTAESTPAPEPTAAPEPGPTAVPTTSDPAPVVLENARDRAYAVTLSVVDGPVSEVEVGYADGRTAVVDPSADPSALDGLGAAGGVVDVRVPDRVGTARYRVAANASLTRRPFGALERAAAGTSVVWVVGPVPADGERATVTAAGVDACAPPHSLVTEFRVRVDLGPDRVRVDCV